MKHVYRQGGFTLIELLIVVVILAVLATLAGPSFGDFIKKYRVRGAADATLAAIATARGAAVKSGRDVTVSVRGADAAWCVGANGAGTPAARAPFAGSSECDCMTPSNCVVDNEIVAVNGAEFTGVKISAAGSPVVVDGKLGLQKPANATGIPVDASLVTFNSPDNKYGLSVRISPMGQASACVPASSAAIAGYATCP